MQAKRSEIIFIVEESPEGGFTAQALGEDIFTEADDLVALQEAIKDAVKCHFGEENCPKIIRLHIVKEDVIGV